MEILGIEKLNFSGLNKVKNNKKNHQNLLTCSQNHYSSSLNKNRNVFDVLLKI